MCGCQNIMLYCYYFKADFVFFTTYCCALYIKVIFCYLGNVAERCVKIIYEVGAISVP